MNHIHLDLVSKEEAGGETANSYDVLWLHPREFGHEPAHAGFDFIRLGVPVIRRTTLNYIGDVTLITPQAVSAKYMVHFDASHTNERAASLVFLFTRGLTNDHNFVQVSRWYCVCT
jgi:hypothetical protein